MSTALDSVAGVRLLLLSLHPGALSSFLDGSDRPGPIVYIDDAQAAFRDAPFVAAEREAVSSSGVGSRTSDSAPDRSWRDRM